MYMCRYMFIWVVYSTPVEMDLMFVLVVRSLKPNKTYNCGTFMAPSIVCSPYVESQRTS